MNKSEFNYFLPEDLIAQTPLERRDASRLLILNKVTGDISHKNFFNLPDIVKSGDCLVLNDSRVLPARLIGVRENGGTVEIVLLRDIGDGIWECMARPGKKVRPGASILFGGGELRAVIQNITDGGNRLIKFYYSGVFLEILERFGEMPLPPYIKKELHDGERYQTVYSCDTGSAAAPTAGLHFTKELLNELEAKGINLCYITLHVGLGTFRPVKSNKIEDHKMHSEHCFISDVSAGIINDTKKHGGKVIAVGTTSCRTLESFTSIDGIVRPGSGWTDIFIYPGYKFKCVDSLITNFHLPESTLIMLVSALAGRENVLEAYKTAIREKYRFFSFGDAMYIQ